MANRPVTDKTLDHLQPPQSLDAEQAVLGAIMKDDEAIHLVIGLLESEVHFYAPKHRLIYRAFLELYERTEPSDITTVANCLLSAGNLEKIGGRVYLVELVEGVASTANVQSYANIVLEKSLLRRLIETSNEITRSAYTLDSPVEELLDAAEANIFEISESRLRHGFVPLKTLVNDSFERIEQFQSGEGSLDSVMTGYTELDTLTQGFHKGDLIVVAGRPSMGKSALAMNIAENVADPERGKHAVAVFSIEMSKEQLALRMLCGRALINQQRLRNRRLTDAELLNLTKHGHRLSQMEVFIDDSATLTTLQIRAKSRRLKAQYPHLSLILVDYIQMMHASGHAENRQQEISVISRSLKALAKELQVPVVVCSQLSRAVEQRGGDKRPQLADLRESGAIEQDADVVMFVYRPEYYLSDDERRDPKNMDKIGVAEIIVAKQRNGPTGTARMTFLREFARFVNMSMERREIPGDAEPVGDTPF
jgi:replicative DNA helicase